MPKPALIIFDVDGTLLQTETVTIPAVCQTLASYGVAAPEADAIRATFGVPVEDYEAWLESLCPPEKAGEIVEVTNRRELELVAEEGRLFAGVHEVLAKLEAAGHTLAACSNASVPYFDAVLDGHDLREYFVAARCIGQGFEGKAVMVADIMSRFDPRPVIVVGDRRGDIKGAHANGGLAIGASYGFGSPEELAEADALVDAFVDIVPVIEEFVAAG